MSVQSQQFYHDVYTILVAECGANPKFRDDFIRSHTEATVNEWRFQGYFGFGGKYWRGRNAITYYPEHRTKQLDVIADQINTRLADLVKVHSRRSESC